MLKLLNSYEKQTEIRFPQETLFLFVIQAIMQKHFRE